MWFEGPTPKAQGRFLLLPSKNLEICFGLFGEGVTRKQMSVRHCFLVELLGPGPLEPWKHPPPWNTSAEVRRSMQGTIRGVHHSAGVPTTPIRRHDTQSGVLTESTSSSEDQREYLWAEPPPQKKTPKESAI